MVVTPTCSLASEKTGHLLLQNSKPLSLNLKFAIISQGMLCITKVIPYFNWGELKEGNFDKNVFLRKSPFTSIDGNILAEPLTSKEDFIVRRKKEEKLGYDLRGYGRQSSCWLLWGKGMFYSYEKVSKKPWFPSCAKQDSPSPSLPKLPSLLWNRWLISY